jgi:aryl-alcohol dehydrogenase-like predicted oxidoreductase
MFMCVSNSARELRALLKLLQTDYVDLLTLYYVEQQSEWDEMAAPGGALQYLQDAKRDGSLRHIGITSHQRKLAAKLAKTGLLDALMIRYNAAHRGAEQDIFPVTGPLGIPLISYTALRWGALLKSTPDDPHGFVVPGAAEWYRFVLQQPAVDVVLCAPQTREELEEDLAVLDCKGPLTAKQYDALASHGERVRKHSGRFS